MFIAALEGGLAVVAVVAGWLVGVDPLAATGWSPLAAGWGVLGSLPLVAFLLVSVHVRWEPLRRIGDTVNDVLRRFFLQAGWIELASVSILAGLGEELLFRGVLQAGLAEWLGGTLGIAVGIAAAAVAFGAAHAVHLPYFIAATFMGAYFGALFWYFESLLVPIVAHAAYDFVAIAYLRYRLVAGETTASEDE